MGSGLGQSGPVDRLVLAPNQRRDAILEVIRSARERLRLSLFRCSDYRIVDELAEAALRKVRVEALLTPRAKGEEAKRLKELGTVLESMGAEVFRYRDPIVKYHAKYLVADDGPAVVSTLNFTAKCFSNTCDFLLVTRDAGVVSGLTKLFECDCVSPEAPLPEDLTERLIVGPDRARARLTDLLRNARRSIRIIDHKVSDRLIVAELKAKKESGVAVEVLGSGQLGELRPHGKMMLVDDARAVIGSIALAPLNMDFRREVAVLIQDPGCVAQLKEFFQGVAAKPSGPAADKDEEEEVEDDD